MNNSRGESGERRESHSVTIQYCSRDQSKTTTLMNGQKEIAKIKIEKIKKVADHLVGGRRLLTPMSFIYCSYMPVQQESCHQILHQLLDHIKSLLLFLGRLSELPPHTLATCASMHGNQVILIVTILICNNSHQLIVTNILHQSHQVMGRLSE